jgi:hypothetical protein
MHALIISRQLLNSLKGENLSYNLGTLYRDTNIRSGSLAVPLFISPT